MPTVPIDEGAPDRRRIGPFWFEEGTRLALAGLAILLAVGLLYALAWGMRPA
ncbi:MAG: hypothetical protein ACYDAC_10250 [Candidatus Dormibacteria bacterium]